MTVSLKKVKLTCSLPFLFPFQFQLSENISTMGSSSSSSSSLEDTEPLPKKYVVLKCLGEGGFGGVVKCLDLETKEIVAVKTAKYHENLSNEVRHFVDFAFYSCQSYLCQ